MIFICAQVSSEDNFRQIEVTMKSIDVTGIGNGIVDIFTDITEERFQPLGFEKGTMRLVDTAEQKALLSALSSGKPPLVSGGSVANSVIALAQLGGESALCCRLADDEFGRFYRDECASLGVKVPVPLAQGGATGTCVVLTTPDAERTMRTSLGANLELSHEHVDARSIADAKWLFIEGYLFANSDGGRAAVREAINVARESGTKVAITCSDAWIVSGFGEHLGEALKHTDLVFANEEESSALAGTKDVQAAGRVLKERFPHVVLTAGPRGAFIWWEGEEIQVPAFPCQPRDLTGAGDAFAGGFLYGVNHGVSPADAARKACFLAHNVITQVGARLRGDVKKLWASV
jgi:sugar/nucleoside kinase (ribokinase family)